MERKVTLRTKKDLNSTKMDQRGKTPDRQKKNPGSVHVGFVVDKVALGQVFPPPEYFGFSLLISFHQSSITRKTEKINRLHHSVAQ
jgi:hypothetical protein